MEFYMPEYTINYEVNKQDAYPLLSPGMKKVIDYQMAHAADAFDTNCSWDELRVKYVEERRVWNEGGPKAFKTIETKVEGPIGEVPIRIYYPDDKPFHNAVVFIHGGGYTVGSNDTHDRMMRNVMHYSGCAVVGINYTLAPEAKFPVPLYESCAVVKWVHEKGEKFGLKQDRIAIGGDSGGANLALGTTLYIRDVFKDNSYIFALLLYYGGYGMSDSCSERLYGTILDGMRRSDLAFYLQCYLNDPKDMENPYLVPLNNDLTHGVPASYLCVGGLDPLRDDSQVLYEILKNHGVRAELEIMPGCLHAYMHYSSMMEEAEHCLKRSGEFIKEELAKTGA